MSSSKKDTSNSTLDREHEMKLKEFASSRDKIPFLERQINDLNKKLGARSNINNVSDLKIRNDILEKISNLKNEITSINSDSKELEYYEENLEILLDYYDKKTQIEVPVTKYISSSQDFDDFINNPSNNKNQSKKVKLYNRYMTNIGSSRLVVNDNNNKCEECNGKMITTYCGTCCEDCGADGGPVIVAEQMLNRDKPNDTGNYAYKRSNHLAEILNQLQAKETTNIPNYIFDSIEAEQRKKNIKTANLDIFILRRVLKKIGHSNYFEHSAFILQRITGKSPPRFTQKEENKIKTMFKNIQDPFQKHKPAKRKNFLNYSFVLHKFCKLIDLDEYVEYFPLLKNPKKLREHDQIWKNICRELKWRWDPSV